MSVNKTGIVVIVLALVAFAIYSVIAGGVTMTGSGGLGAVSFGISEALVEVALLAVVVVGFYYGRSWWQQRRR